MRGMPPPSPRPLRGFPPAARGLRLLVRSERHARFHLAATLAVAALAAWCRVTPGEAASLALAVGLVLAAEALNSAVERLADRVTREPDPLIRDAKDLAAGGVLVAAAAALVVGLAVFLPRLLAAR